MIYALAGGSCMSYRGYLRSGGRGSAGGDESQGTVERGTGSVSATSLVERRSGIATATQKWKPLCRLLGQSTQRSGIHHSVFLSRPTTSCGSILSMGPAKWRIAPAR